WCPGPGLAVAVARKTKRDQAKLGAGRQRLSDEDPTFRVRTDEETGQTIISGMGELHLEIIVDRMMREFNVDANVGRPQVAYRETIGKRVEKIQGRFVRQTGDRGQYGDAVINMEPAPRGPYEFRGGVMDDLNSRRGHIEGREPRGNAQVIRARVPLATMFGYATDLRSTTQGRATFTMQFDRYEQVPQSIAGEIVAAQT